MGCGPQKAKCREHFVSDRGWKKREQLPMTDQMIRSIY